jgi:hypothetical protein
VKIRKQVYHLTLEDLGKSPVWEFALDEEGEEGQDEATVRPYEFSGKLDPSEGMFVCAASFTLADGSQMQGYLTPPVQGDDGPGTLQPIIVTTEGQIGFWCGVRTPSSEELSKYYRLLGRNADRVFPVQFESKVELVEAPVHGSLAGFIVLEDWQTGKVKILK